MVGLVKMEDPKRQHPACDRRNCINWKDGRCGLKHPEKDNGACLDFEDSMDFLRLRADAIKGSLV